MCEKCVFYVKNPVNVQKPHCVHTFVSHHLSPHTKTTASRTPPRVSPAHHYTGIIIRLIKAGIMENTLI